MKPTLLEVRNVWKEFEHLSSPKMLRDLAAEFFRPRQPQHNRFAVLQDVSFQVSAGESLAIVGSNGAGKTTLLSLICGLAQPNLGSVHVHARLAPLLALGAGFHHDLTGRENLFLNAALLGMTADEVEQEAERMIDFSEIRPFIDDPLRVYSAGMTLRLAFSVAAFCSADIMVIDEVLAVGDLSFQQKCFRHLRHLREQGRSIICVSHSNQMLKDLCDRAIWLDRGRVAMDGEVSRVVAAYVEAVESWRRAQDAAVVSEPQLS